VLLGWPELLALITSLGFGVLSAIVPLANAEAYVIASQVTAVAGPVPIAIGIGAGQSVGKLLIFLGVRRGRDFWFLRRRRHDVAGPGYGSTPGDQPTGWFGRAQARVGAAIAWLLRLVASRWGLPIVLLAAVVGIPPLYAVAVVAGASRMRALWFWIVVLLGRVARFVLVALGIAGMFLC